MTCHDTGRQFHKITVCTVVQYSYLCQVSPLVYTCTALAGFTGSPWSWSSLTRLSRFRPVTGDTSLTSEWGDQLRPEWCYIVTKHKQLVIACSTQKIRILLRLNLSISSEDVHVWIGLAEKFDFNRFIIGLLLLNLKVLMEERWELSIWSDDWVGVLGTGHNTGPECRQLATPLCHELSDQSDIMTISDQWWPRRSSWGSPDPTSWPRILLDPSSRHPRKVNGWGTDGKLCSVQCTMQCVQCVHQTWSMAGSLVPCVHTLANIPRNELSLSWHLMSAVSIEACHHLSRLTHAAVSPAVTGRGLLKSVYLLCDSHYWGL